MPLRNKIQRNEERACLLNSLILAEERSYEAGEKERRPCLVYRPSLHRHRQETRQVPEASHLT